MPPPSAPTDPNTATDLQQRIATLAARHGWRLVVLFGSTAREGSGRDVDLAVLPAAAPDLFTEGRWQRDLEDAFETRPVDLLVLTDHTSPLVRFEVFRDGVCLHQNPSGAFEREQDRAFFLHADSHWLRDATRVPGHGE